MEIEARESNITYILIGHKGRIFYLVLIHFPFADAKKELQPSTL